MLNKKPIILNCFARGGSQMLVNLCISHPDVCLSSGETHKVFKPGTPFDAGWLRWKKRFLYDWPTRMMVGQDIFDPHLLTERKRVPEYLLRRIDRIFYEGRFLNRIPEQNLYRYEGVEYTRDELARCRLVTKSLNGLVFLVDMFREMYPDAVFVALVRNGLAICEGSLRRRYTAEEIGLEYHTVVRRMLANRNSMPNYHILRYEDMVSDIASFVKNLYGLAGLSVADVPKFRLEARPVTTADGKHERLKGSYDRQLFWYELANIQQHVRSDVNQNQIKKLSASDRNTFLSIAGDVMEELGYNTR